MSNYQYNQIKNDFEQELADVIDDILGNESYQVQKEQLTNSLLDIFSQYSERYMNQIESQYYQNNLPALPNEFTNSNNCFSNLPINLYILVDPQNSFPTQPLYYPQPTINPPMQQNPPIQQNPFQMQMIQQPPILPQPSLPFFPQLPILDPITPKKSEKSKKKHKKDKKHSHKSKDSSDKKKKKESKKEPKKEEEIKTFSLQPGNEFQGIFHYLSSTKSGNIHDNGIIEVTSNNLRSSSDSKYHPKNVVDSNNNTTQYMANGGNEAYICFDFKEKRVEITDYVVKNSNSGGKIRNWVFEISDDKNVWTEIDKNTDYRFSGQMGSFKVRPNRFVRYCRLRHTGQFTDMVYNLVINAIELFGRIKIPK